MIDEQRDTAPGTFARVVTQTLQAALGRVLPGGLIAVTVYVAAAPFCGSQPPRWLEEYPPAPTPTPTPAPAPRPVDTVPAGAVIAPASADRPALVHVPAGRADLGRAPWEASYVWESSQHAAIVAGFELCATEVTQGQYEHLLGRRPSDCGRAGVGCSDAHPVNNVSWYDAVSYLNALSRAEGLTPCYRGDGFGVTWDHACTGYRLPSETEWEYAARAGGWSPAPELLQSFAWYGENAYYQRAHPVARKRVNPWGLHDMIGNVDEWVWDEFLTDERAVAWPRRSIEIPDNKRRRVHRGGSYGLGPRENDPAFRVGNPPGFKFWTLGFRCARSIPAPRTTHV